MRDQLSDSIFPSTPSMAQIDKVICHDFTPEKYSKVGRSLLAKILREFAYEGLIAPHMHLMHQREKDKAQKDLVRFTLTFRDENKGQKRIIYSYKGQRRILGDYKIDPSSIERFEERLNGGQEEERINVPTTVSPLQFMIDCYQELDIKPFTCAYFVKELQNTMMSDLTLLNHAQSIPSWQLLEKDYEELEGYLPGHPWLVVSKGRMGFGFTDHLRFSPEARGKLSLHWLAISKKKGVFTSLVNLSYGTLMETEIDEESRRRFTQKLQGMNLRPDDYYFIPVHEWQWERILIPHFIEDLNNRDMVYLGEGEEAYLPQQAIRTLSPTKDSHRHYVKLTMTLFNTAVYRGLPRERVKIAADLSSWLSEIHQQDSFLAQELKVILLKEVAGLYYDHAYFSQIENPPYQFNEMLGVIWREPLSLYLEEGEKALSLAALLHQDVNGRSLAGALIAQSGIEAREWIRKFHQVVLTPLLHFMYQYGVAFNAHGQNLILVTNKGIPVRLAIKDFSDDVNCCERAYPELAGLPESCKNVILHQPPEILRHFIFSSLFICLYRYMSDLLAEESVLEEKDFWALAREAILQYQDRFQHLSPRFKEMDLLSPTMIRVCLNRVRALTFGYSDDSGRPEPAVWGEIENPLWPKELRIKNKE